MNEPVIWHEANLVTILDNQEIEVIVDGALVIQEGKIIWLGKAKDISKDNYPKAKWQSAKGALITPGLIDCHTHLVYGKNRANEWERRLRGERNGEIYFMMLFDNFANKFIRLMGEIVYFIAGNIMNIPVLCSLK